MIWFCVSSLMGVVSSSSCAFSLFSWSCRLHQHQVSSHLKKPCLIGLVNFSKGSAILYNIETMFQRLTFCKPSLFLLMFTLLRDCMAFQPLGCEQALTYEHPTLFFFRFQCLKILPFWPQSDLPTNRGCSCSQL